MVLDLQVTALRVNEPEELSCPSRLGSSNGNFVEHSLTSDEVSALPESASHQAAHGARGASLFATVAGLRCLALVPLEGTRSKCAPGVTIARPRLL